MALRICSIGLPEGAGFKPNSAPDVDFSGSQERFRISARLRLAFHRYGLLGLRISDDETPIYRCTVHIKCRVYKYSYSDRVFRRGGVFRSQYRQWKNKGLPTNRRSGKSRVSQSPCMATRTRHSKRFLRSRKSTARRSSTRARWNASG